MKIVKVVLVSIVLLFACSAVQAKDQNLPYGQLVNQIDYWFAGDQVDEQGRVLVWEGTITGGIDGDIYWWFVMPPGVQGSPFNVGRTAFYQARWEIWSEDELILAGESAGKTFFVGNQDGIWDGVGVVTEASGKYNTLKGRKIYESGPVVMGDAPPASMYGAGMFSVY